MRVAAWRQRGGFFPEKLAVNLHMTSTCICRKITAWQCQFLPPQSAITESLLSRYPGNCSQNTRVASWSESIVLFNHQSIEKEAEAVHLECSIRLSSGAGARFDVGAPRHDASAWKGLVGLACSLCPPFKRGQSDLPLILELSVLLLPDSRSGPYSVV
jgi:hypothetical protein